MSKIYCTQEKCENYTTDADIEGKVEEWKCWEHDECEHESSELIVLEDTIDLHWESGTATIEDRCQSCDTLLDSFVQEYKGLRYP